MVPHSSAYAKSILYRFGKSVTNAIKDRQFPDNSTRRNPICRPPKSAPQKRLRRALASFGARHGDRPKTDTQPPSPLPCIAAAQQANAPESPALKANNRLGQMVVYCLALTYVTRESNCVNRDSVVAFRHMNAKSLASLARAGFFAESHMTRVVAPTAHALFCLKGYLRYPIVRFMPSHFVTDLENLAHRT